MRGTAVTGNPIVVDLDGTLTRADTLHESALRLLRDKPLETLRIPYWLLRGKAFLKHHLADSTAFDAASLPYHQDFLTWLREQRAQGQRLVLCTASDQTIANAVSEHLGVFDQVIASDGRTNMSGERKAEMLERSFGYAGFDYAGNSRDDLPVWRSARHAVVVNASQNVKREAERGGNVAQVFPAQRAGLHVWTRVLRVHQWAKNFLLFVPLLAAHQVSQFNAWLNLMLAFIAFSLCASAVYIFNDLLDLDSDRQHPRKCLRPFAAGAVPTWQGVALAPLLLLGSLWAASEVNGVFLAWMLLYFTLTCAYSSLLKRIVLIDTMTLASLYTLRVIAGAAAVAMDLSFWLLAFSVFLFLSLAFVKRYSELQVSALNGKSRAYGRSYEVADGTLLQMLGVAAGYAAALVLALYLNSTAVLNMYRTPEFIWAAVPVLLFWISWMWMQAHRGRMHDDPLIFAMRDRMSLGAGAAFAAVILVGTMEWQWHL